MNLIVDSLFAVGGVVCVCVVTWCENINKNDIGTDEDRSPCALPLTVNFATVCARFLQKNYYNVSHEQAIAVFRVILYAVEERPRGEMFESFLKVFQAQG